MRKRMAGISLALREFGAAAERACGIFTKAFTGFVRTYQRELEHRGDELSSRLNRSEETR